MFVEGGGRERGEEGEGEERIKEGWQKEREGEREGNTSMNLIPGLYLRLQPLNPLNNTPDDQNLLKAIYAFLMKSESTWGLHFRRRRQSVAQPTAPPAEQPTDRTSRH